MRKFLIISFVLASLLVYGCFSDITKEYIPGTKGTPITDTIKDKDKVKPDKKEKPAVQKEKVVIYRASSDGAEKLLPETVTITKSNRALALEALEALCSTKPSDAKYDDVIPVGTKVLGLTIKEDGTAVADFSKELARRGQGSYEEMMAVYAIVNTLTEYPEIKQVQILIEGKKRVMLGSHIDIEEPIKRNNTLLKK